MIIKIVLILTVVSINGKYEGVHYSSHIDSYLEFKMEDFELFNVKCHYAIFRTICSDVSDSQSMGCNLTIQEKNFYKGTKNESKMDLPLYMFRLLRIYYNGANSHLKNLRSKIWQFYMRLMDVEHSAYSLKNCAKELMSSDVWSNPRSSKLITYYFRKEYEQCVGMLKLLSEPTEHFIKKELSQIFYNQAVIYNANMENVNAVVELPVSIEYGFILLLLKEEEKVQFMELKNDKHKQKIFVANMMKEALISTFFIIKKELKKIGHNIVHEIKSIVDRDHNPITVKMKIIKSMFMKIIDATEAIFNIHGMETTGPNLIGEYTTVMNMVKAKKNQLYPESHVKQGCADLIKNFIFCRKKQHSIEIDDHIPVKSFREKQDDIEIIDPFPGRLTINGSIRVPIFKCTIKFNVQEISYLSNIDIDPQNTKEIDNMKKLLNSDNNIHFLLDVHGWILIIKEYAFLMKNGMSPKPTRQHSTIAQTNIFNGDREFLKEFKIIHE